MVVPKESILIFFPRVPRPENPFSREADDEIIVRLHRLLRSDTALIDGYEISNSDGWWYSFTYQRWEGDQNWVIRSYTSGVFAPGLYDPDTPSSDEKKFLARIARLSCVEMGHAEFFSVINNNQTLRGTQIGLELNTTSSLPDGILPYEKILGH